MEHADAGVALAVVEQPLALIDDEPLHEDDVVDLARGLLRRLRDEERRGEPRELLGRFRGVDQRLAGAVRT